jgi:hypothetical protein
MGFYQPRMVPALRLVGRLSILSTPRPNKGSRSWVLKAISKDENGTGIPFGGFLVAVSVLLAACSVAFKTRGNDIWWHIRTGQWIWENGTIPATDPFSHTAAGAPWAYTDWLSQLFFYAVDSLGGAELLVVSKMVIVGVVAALLARTRRADAGGTALALFVCTAAMHLRLVLKPELFSFVFFAGVWLLLLRVDEHGRRALLWIVPPLLVLWGNFHRGGTIALVLLGAAALAWAIDKRRRRLLPVTAAVFGLSVGALLLNPGGCYYLTSALKLGTSPALLSVSEWMPLGLDMPWPSIPWFLVLCAAWAAGWVLVRRRANLETFAVLLMVVLSFRAVRFIPFAAMVMFPGLAGDLSILAGSIVRRLSKKLRPRLLQAGFIAVGLAVLGQNYLASYPPSVRGLGAATWLLPVDVANFLSKNPPPGRMWNSLNLSGYLLYRLFPEKKVFIDGRADTVYSMDFYEETLRASRDPVVLFRQLDKYDIGFAVVELGRNQAAREGTIFGDPGWSLVYWGDRAAVMVRRSAAASDYLSEYAYSHLRVDTALKRLSKWHDDPDRALLAGEVLENLRRAPNSIRAHYLAALAHRNMGNREGYLHGMKVVESLAARRDLELPRSPQ